MKALWSADGPQPREGELTQPFPGAPIYLLLTYVRESEAR
jgi:hypothetical protein